MKCALLIDYININRMLRQYQSIQIGEDINFDKTEELLQIYTYNSFIIRIFPHSIDIIDYDQLADRPAPSECFFSQKDLLDDLLRYCSTKSRLTIFKVVSHNDYMVLFIQADQAFYACLVYLPKLTVNQLKNIFSSVTQVSDSKIMQLSRINVIASLIKFKAGNQTYQSVDILGFQSNSSQIYFCRVQISRKLMLFIEPLKQLKYPKNYPKHNQKPVIKALFIERTNKFLIFLYQKMYICTVKEKFGNLSIEHDQKKAMNVKMLMQQIIKKESETSMLFDICATDKQWIFLIRTNSQSAFQASEFCFTLLFIQSSFLQNPKVVRDHFIMFSADDYNRQQSCRLTILQQLPKSILLGVSCGNGWRVLNYGENGSNYLFGGHSIFTVQKINRFRDKFAVTSKQAIRLIPLQLLFVSPTISLPSASQSRRDFKQRSNYRSIQNQRTGGPLFLQNSNLQILQQDNFQIRSVENKDQQREFKRIGNNRNNGNNSSNGNNGNNSSNGNNKTNNFGNREQVRAINNNIPLVNNLRNNNRLYLELKDAPIPESRQVNSEEEYENQSENTNNRAINNGITNLLGQIFQQRSYPLNPSHPQQASFNQISFGAQQIMFENQRPPSNGPQYVLNNYPSFSPDQITIQNKKQVVNPFHILQNSPIFSLSSQQIAQNNMPSPKQIAANKIQGRKVLNEDKSFQYRVSSVPLVVSEEILHPPATRKKSKQQIQRIKALMQKMESCNKHWQNQQSLIIHQAQLLQHRLQNNVKVLFPTIKTSLKILKEQIHNPNIKQNILSQEGILRKFIQQLTLILPQHRQKNISREQLEQKCRKAQELYDQKVQETRMKLVRGFRSLGLMGADTIRRLQSYYKKPGQQQTKKLDIRQIIEQKLIKIKLKLANLSYEWQQIQQKIHKQIDIVVEYSKKKRQLQWKRVRNLKIEYNNGKDNNKPVEKQFRKQTKREKYIKMVVFPTDFHEFDPTPLLYLESID